MQRKKPVNDSVINYTGKNSAEKTTEVLGFVNDQANSGFMDTMLVLLSNIDGIKKLIEMGSKYLFPLAFALKLADWFLYTIKYIQSANKNVGKTSNLLLKTLTTPLIGIAVFGTAIVSAAVAPIIFSAVIGLDVVISFVKSIYFIAKSIGKSDHEKAFYRDKAKENGIKTVVGALLLAGIIVGMIFAPHIAFAIVAAVAVIAAATIITMGIIGIVQRIKSKRALNALKNTSDIEHEYDVKPTKENKKEIEIAKKINSRPSMENEQKGEPAAKFIFKPSENKYTGFFDNTVNLLVKADTNVMESKTELIGNIEKYSKKLDKDKDLEDKSNIKKFICWSELAKRKQKLATLSILNNFISQFDKILADKNNSMPKLITLNDGKEIPYNNINDLILKVDKHITDGKSKAYQSFFKDVGGVEALTKQTYKLLLALRDNPMPVNNDDEQPHVMPSSHRNY